MIDRKARDEMTAAIRSFMSETITEATFCDAVEAVATDDETVEIVGEALWFHYDDFDDRRICASKEEWDYFNRLLLLLESDAEIEVVASRRRWRLRHLAAALSLAAFLLVALIVGWGWHLLLYAIPFAPVSMFLSEYASREWKQSPAPAHPATTPFPSIGSLLSVRRRMTRFVRTRYPATIAERLRATPDRVTIGPFFLSFGAVCTTMLWFPLSPAALFFQMFPGREAEMRVKTGNAPGSPATVTVADDYPFSPVRSR